MQYTNLWLELVSTVLFVDLSCEVLVSPLSSMLDAVDGVNGGVCALDESLVLDLRIFSSNQLYPGNSWHILVWVCFRSPNSLNLCTTGSVSINEKDEIFGKLHFGKAQRIHT